MATEPPSTPCTGTCAGRQSAERTLAVSAAPRAAAVLKRCYEEDAAPAAPSPHSSVLPPTDPPLADRKEALKTPPPRLGRVVAVVSSSPFFAPKQNKVTKRHALNPGYNVCGLRQHSRGQGRAGATGSANAGANGARCRGSGGRRGADDPGACGRDGRLPSGRPRHLEGDGAPAPTPTPNARAAHLCAARAYRAILPDPRGALLRSSCLRLPHLCSGCRS